MIGQAALVTYADPRKCTAMTKSNSSSVMFLNDLSRKIPALLTTISTLPKAATASSTMLFAPSRSDTDALLAMATPPAAVISSTTTSDISLAPAPCTLPPRSLTTTFAPRSANANAWQRPRPPPAPVTMATLPSKSLIQPPSL